MSSFAFWHRIAASLNLGPQTFALTRRQKLFGAGVVGGGGVFGLVSLVAPTRAADGAAPVFADSGGGVAVAQTQAGADTRHHVAGGGFANPWASFRAPGASFALSFAQLLLLGDRRPPLPPPPLRVRTQQIDWPRLAAAAAEHEHEHMLLTWLGHAAFLLTLPGARVLLDPCLSDRCSPLSWAGPQRLVAPPCKLEDLDPDVVVISHNHYDHLDLDVMKKLVQKKKDLLFFVPLGNKKLLVDAGITNVVECDWWDSYSVHKPKTDVSPEANLQISCTPSQHFSSRTLWDKNQTLWSSWHIQSTAFSHETPPTTSPSNNDANHAHNTNHGHNHSNECDITTSSPRPITKSFFFGGDTGYRTVFTSEDEENAPTCPAFRQVREKFGDTDLAALPIGAYNPRHLLSNVHCSPKDAVEVHLDLGAKKSVAMHWGTFVLSREDVMEPPRLLREEMAKRGVREDEFLVIEVGETVSA